MTVLLIITLGLLMAVATLLMIFRHNPSKTHLHQIQHNCKGCQSRVCQCHSGGCSCNATVKRQEDDYAEIGAKS